MLAGALITSMLLNAKMADTAYRMKEKQVELNVAEDHVETLRTQVQEASAPDALAGRRNRRFRYIRPALWVGEHWRE